MSLGALMHLAKPGSNMVCIHVPLPPLQPNKDCVGPFAHLLAAVKLPAAFQEPLPFHSFHVLADAQSCAVI